MRRLAAAAAAVLLLAGCAGGEDEPDADATPPGSTSATPGESPSGAVDPPEPTEVGPVVRCPRATQERDPGLPDAVPDGATSVRLCDGGADKVAPPDDALTTEVASVVAAVNDQPVVARRCVELRIPEYQLAFGYPDGSRFVVAGRFTGCGELLVGSGRRDRATPALRAFVDGLRAQRSTTTAPAPPATPAELDCTRPASTLPVTVARPTELTEAVLCFGPAERPEGARSVPIPPDDLATLVRSMQTHTASTTDAFCRVVVGDDYWIVGVTGWGDPVVARRGCFGLTVDGYLEWTPRAADRAIIDRLVAEIR